MRFLDSWLLRSRPSASGGNEHFMCCGSVHVKVVTFYVIVIRFSLWMAAAVMFYSKSMTDVSQVISLLMECGFLISLIFGFFTERPLYFLPVVICDVMAIVFCLLLSGLSVAVAYSPERFQMYDIGSGLPHINSRFVRRRAIAQFLGAVCTILLILLELRILHRCRAYFNQKQEARDTLRRQMQAVNQMENGVEVPGKAAVVHSFENPNFGLDDSDGEEATESGLPKAPTGAIWG